MSGLEKTVVNSSDVVPLGSDHNGRNITPPASCMQIVELTSCYYGVR
jgi:hypothetical protein